MALSIVKCPLCEWAFQAHAYQKGGMVRTHFKEAHPEARPKSGPWSWRSTTSGPSCARSSAKTSC